jgi:hypothetical protein
MNNKLQTKISRGILSYERWKCQHRFRKFGKILIQNGQFFRHTRTHGYHMRIRMASHSSSLFVITHPSEWYQVLLYRHPLHHSLTPWSSLLRRYSPQSQEILCILWYMKIYYRVKYIQKMVPILSHIKPAFSLLYYFCKIHLNNIASAKPKSLKWYHSFMFPFRNPVWSSQKY